MEAAKSATGAAEESKLHFLDYWRIIRIRKTVILAVFLLVVLTTTAVTFILPEYYASTVRIAVEKDTSDITPLLGMPTSGNFDPYFLQTEYEKIESKVILYEVIRDMDLNVKWAKRHGAEGSLRQGETFLILKKNVNVKQSRNTSLIEITVTSEDKQEAADIANKIAATYKKHRLEVRQDRSKKGIEVLQAKYNEQTDKVNQLQQRVDKYKKELNISDSAGESSSASMMEPETVRRMELERITAQSMQVEYNTMLQKLKALSAAELRRAVSVAFPADSQLPQLFDKLAQTDQELARVGPDLGKDNPDLKKLEDLRATISNQIDQRIEGLIQGLEVRAAAAESKTKFLANEVETAKHKDAEMSEKYQPYFTAKRDLSLEMQYRNVLMGRILQETADAALPKESVVDITDPAEPGLRPDRPKVALNITLGAIVGLIVGIGLAFFIEYLDTSVKTIDDVERALQAPVLGVIPQNVGPLMNEGPESPHAEVYRVLRTNVLFSRKGEKANTLTVVSGGAGEGKSTTICNLATIFAQNGARVLLVDSDLRRPSLHKIFNVSNALGLTNYLLKQNTLEQVVQTTKVPQLDFLPSGKLPSSSMGVLNSAAMREFIQEVKRRYDFVFFDSPPIMGVSDASILASEVDVALLVVQYRKYPQAMTVRAKQMVEKVGGTLLGVVLNNINISQDSYYYYYSGYYYDYYSKNEDDDTGGGRKNGEKKLASAAGAGEQSGRPQVDIKKKY